MSYQSLAAPAVKLWENLRACVTHQTCCDGCEVATSARTPIAMSALDPSMSSILEGLSACASRQVQNTDGCLLMQYKPFLRYTFATPVYVPARCAQCVTILQPER